MGSEQGVLGNSVEMHVGLPVFKRQRFRERDEFLLPQKQRVSDSTYISFHLDPKDTIKSDFSISALSLCKLDSL